MKPLKLLTILMCVSAISACSKATEDQLTFPKDPSDARREARGKITGEDGISILGDGGLFGKKKGYGGGPASTVNPFLWRASLETISFMPVASADPFGGILITDWYEDPKTPGERFRVNVMILDIELRSDAVRVNVFKQSKGLAAGEWRDIPVEPRLGREMEETILTKARELRIKQAG